MSETQKFKTKYDEMRQGNPATPASANVQGDSLEIENKLYKHPGNIRHVCFVFSSGNMRSFSYAYLVSKDLDVTGDINSMTLYFTSEIVTLKGYNLHKLLFQLDNQTAYIIEQVDPRYIETREEGEITITEIQVNTAP